jgi:hypothetical protein
MKPKDIKICIPEPSIQMLTTVIEGTAPLIMHQWSEKAKSQIKEKQAGQKKKVREVRNPEEEYQASYYRNSDGAISFPALCIKQAMVNAARNIEGVTMTVLRGAIFVKGDKDGLIPVDYKSERMREDMVRLGGFSNPADIRYRGEVTDWSMKIVVQHNADVITASMVLNLLNTAGFACGLGEWRPERNGDKGTFRVRLG